MYSLPLFAAATLLFVSCADSSTSIDRKPHAMPTASTSWLDEYVLVDSIVPEQDGDNFIVAVSGVDFTRDHMTLADFSESTVKLFSRPNYDLVWTMGGKGEGPGEFSAPFSPQFDEQGRIHVADYGPNPITVFD